MNDIYTQSFYPVSVAADMAGYNRRSVYKLVESNKIRWRLCRGRHVVHLGSLLARRKQRRRIRQLGSLHCWLRTLPARKRDVLTYQELAILASAVLGYPVSEWAIVRAWRRLKLPRRRPRRTM